MANTPGWESPEPARQRRAAQIERFADWARKTGEAANFADIAEYYSREDQSILPNEEKRAAAFILLARDLLAGVFEENGRSQVLFLHPAIPRGWKKREWFKEAIAGYDLAGDYARSYLAYCWIPWRVFERWRVRNHLPASPRFQPLDKSTQLTRPQRPRDRRKPDRERAQTALKELYPNGVPDQAIVPNKILLQRVSEKLEHLKLAGVSDDTTLRAAGRRK